MDKLQNFWFYYKKHLLIILAVLMVAGYLAFQSFQTVEPDYHIGLVRIIPYTDEEIHSMEAAFAAVGQDINGDGEIRVQIHTYYVDLEDSSPNAGVTNAETISALDADLVGSVSGIFLLEDVDAFRRITNDVLSDSVTPLENGLSLTLRKNADAAYITLAEKIA